MKKIFTLIAICFLAVTDIKAQKVYIPDPNVRAYLQNLATNCKNEIFTNLGIILVDGFDADSMIIPNFQNLTHIAATVPGGFFTSISLPNKGITTMEGMQYIHDIFLLNIDLSHNLIDNNGYRIIPAADYIGHNSIGSSDGVNFSHNLLSGNLFNFLQSTSGNVDYSYNNFTSCSYFDGDHGIFNASHNAISGAVYVAGAIGELNLDSNQITSVSIGSLSDGSYAVFYYHNFNFSHNNISSLPSLDIDSYAASQLRCNFSYNKISSLSILTNPSSLGNNILYINLGNNLLTNLPQNNLISMTTTVGIDTLDLSGNNIACLPEIPNKIKALNIQNTNVQCLYNKPVGVSISPNLPLCNSTNNPNNCPTFGTTSNYVNIPDTSFGKFLLAQYPSCLYKDASNLYWMDTTCSAVVNEDSLTVFVSPDVINTLEGIEYFKNLQYLNCSGNGINTISKLPKSLKYLNASFNKLTTFSGISDSLTFLDISFTEIKKLSSLPSHLETLVLQLTKVDSLPVLPSGLKTLSMQKQVIEFFHTSTLKYIPSFPASLEQIVLRSPALKSLPALPGSLKTLQVEWTNLTILPTLPNSLNDLFIQGDTSLKVLPDFPVNLKQFSLAYTPVECFPKLPDSLKEMSLIKVPVFCLPNSPVNLAPNSFKLYDENGNVIRVLQNCNSTNNPNNCPVYPANYVNIPDANFGAFLIAKYPSCLYKDANNLYWMDTTCSGLVNEDSLNCFNKQIKSIIGVEYFKNLLQLNCRYNMLTGLPSLPKGIKELDCSANLLIALPVLYDSLKILNCSQNKLTGLPSLPKGIKELNCFNNQIMTLPILPDSLRLLYCTSNLLTYIPVLPDSLYLLDCGGNKIDSLPTLPNSLRILFCSYNLLNQLPALNNSISVLGCSGNKLTSLPTLPDSLLYLYCDYNKLTSLPPLPNKLVYFECENNLLSGLPTLPINLVSLTISNNNISCLPKLPSGLQIFGSYNTNINCLPNGFVGYDSSFHPPICNPTNNANQCVAFPTVVGRVFTDNNSNGIKDANEFYRPFVKELASNGDATFSNLNGAFAFSFDSTGSYSLKTIAPKYFKAVPDSNSFSFANNNVYISVPDIALQPTAVKDSLAIVVTPLNSRARPGFSFPYHLVYANAGTTNLYTTVSFTYDTSRLVYDSSSVAIISNTNNTIVISTDSLIAGQGKYATLYFTVKPTAVIGDTLFAVASATSPATTTSSANATIIRGSFDPNDKVATPQLTPTQVANGDWIEYTIRFQNTGNDTAVNVVLADSLSILLQSGYFNVVATSHLANLTYSFKNNIVYFEFLNINLPDSATNYNASQGWVTFKVKPLSGVTVGTYIDNKASIYFDYNKPVVTNLARTLISTIVPIKLLNYSLRLTQEDKKVLNEWTTANEINASHFNIQRSIDGVNFKTVGQVKAVGVSSYSFTDNSLSSNEKQKTIFYRLQMVDNDGRFEYSPIREISFQPSISSIRIYPNPAKELVTIECANARELSITDYLGKRILNKKIMNNQSSIINLQGFAKGIYLVQVVLDNGSIKTEKLIVE